MSFREPALDDLENLFEAFKEHEFYRPLVGILAEQMVASGRAMHPRMDAEEMVVYDLWKDGFRWRYSPRLDGDTRLYLHWDLVRTAKIKEYYNLVVDYQQAKAEKYQRLHYMKDDARMSKKRRFS